jgi:formaldehyde-activating enzyme
LNSLKRPRNLPFTERLDYSPEPVFLQALIAFFWEWFCHQNLIFAASKGGVEKEFPLPCEDIDSKGLKMSDERIIMRVGEALVAGGPPGTAAEPEVAIGEMNGPMGTAFANLLGDQVKGHTRVLAIMNTDIMVRPATLMVSKVTVKDPRYTNILMGTVQGAIANGVLDAVRSGDIPKEKANDLGIIVSVWLSPAILEQEKIDHKALFDIHREATFKAIQKALRNEPSIDWLLENQEKIVHKYYQMGLDGKI